MNVHKNARLTPRGREVLISRLKRGEHPQDVSAAMGVSVGTVYKWRRRYRAEGLAGLLDRSSRPKASPNRTPDVIEAKVIALRKERRIYPLHRRRSRRFPGHRRTDPDPPRPQPLARPGARRAGAPL